MLRRRRARTRGEQATGRPSTRFRRAIQRVTSNRLYVGRVWPGRLAEQGIHGWPRRARLGWVGRWSRGGLGRRRGTSYIRARTRAQPKPCVSELATAQQDSWRPSLLTVRRCLFLWALLSCRPLASLFLFLLCSSLVGGGFIVFLPGYVGSFFCSLLCRDIYAFAAEARPDCWQRARNEKAARVQLIAATAKP
ncbi:hypothetical protein BDY21DRAFT_188476 [Lineolata rhizophorae]|uniref:Uncharacterized protein n=1 Tax=Lineolata rhizophorae TaxID=578093 RepID=A0A6A6P5N2_9PEZI|nr:hypothetical protein BDY21DRAFT_188476 [Lineolata rhizophorae]